MFTCDVGWWRNFHAAHDPDHRSIYRRTSRQQSQTTYIYKSITLSRPTTSLLSSPSTFNQIRPHGKMSRQSTTKTSCAPAPGSIKLSYAPQPLPDELVQELEKTITEAGLEIQERRCYTEDQHGRIDHVVEIIAVYDGLTADQWSGLVDLVVRMYCEPMALGNTVWAARKVM